MQQVSGNYVALWKNCNYVEGVDLVNNFLEIKQKYKYIHIYQVTVVFSFQGTITASESTANYVMSQPTANYFTLNAIKGQSISL